MVANEPYQAGKVGAGRLVDNEPQHGLVFHFVNVESQGPNCNSYHRLTVMEELNGLGVEGEVVCVLIIEEVNCVLVETK